MRMPFLLAVVVFSASTVMATISVDVYLADEQTPLGLVDPNTGVYEDIMVGTKLTLFISSDTAENWDGALWFPSENWGVGILSARDFSEESHGFIGSCLEAAGFLAQVTEGVDDSGLEISLFAAGNPIAGDWFVFDYQADAIGVCCLGLYELESDPNSPSSPGYEWPDWEYQGPPSQLTLIDIFTLNHVPSRDYDGDGLVNFLDFAVLASEWGTVSNIDPNMTPLSDLDTNNSIDIHDMVSFCDYWLERTDASLSANDPNSLDSSY